MEALINKPKVRDVNASKKLKMVLLLMLFLLLLFVTPTLFAQSTTATSGSMTPFDGNYMFLLLAAYLFVRHKIKQLGNG